MSIRNFGMALALLVLPATVAAFEKMRGLDALETQRRGTLPHKSQGRPETDATRTCQVYPRYAVLWSDEGIMGVVDLEVRSRPKGMRPEDVCGDGFQGRSVRPAEDGTPAGVFDHYLVTVFPDGFGVLGSFTIFDLDTGAKVFGDEYAFGQELDFASGPGGPTLTYWAVLRELDCIPRRGDASCWKRVRERQGIPPTVQQPDCERVVAKDPSVLKGAPARSLQVTLHVRVPRLSRRAPTYLPDVPSCDATP